MYDVWAIRNLPFEERFDMKYWPEPMSGCWLWMAVQNGRGYGRFNVDGKNVSAHRFSYERNKGTIPEGLVIDHLCNTRACVNPEHLTATTDAKNILRGKGLAANNARKTHCVHGHKFTPENTKIERDGSRRCRACCRIKERKYYWCKRQPQKGGE